MTQTLTEVKDAVIAYYLQENTLEPDTQTDLIKFECEDPLLKIAMIKQVLSIYEKLEMVSKVSFERAGKNVDVWVLNKSLATYDQTVTFGFRTALGITSVINDYCKHVGNTQEVCDGSSLKERDIQKLVLIIRSLLPDKVVSS